MAFIQLSPIGFFIFSCPSNFKTSLIIHSNLISKFPRPGHCHRGPVLAIFLPDSEALVQFPDRSAFMSIVKVDSMSKVDRVISTKNGHIGPVHFEYHMMSRIGEMLPLSMFHTSFSNVCNMDSQNCPCARHQLSMSRIWRVKF